MKTFNLVTIAILIIVLLAASLALGAFNQTSVSPPNLAASALQTQATISPVGTDRSEVGSTNGIIIMGFVIVAVISIPLVFRKKRK